MGQPNNPASGYNPQQGYSGYFSSRPTQARPSYGGGFGGGFGNFGQPAFNLNFNGFGNPGNGMGYNNTSPVQIPGGFGAQPNQFQPTPQPNQFQPMPQYQQPMPQPQYQQPAPQPMPQPTPQPMPGPAYDFGPLPPQQSVTSGMTMEQWNALPPSTRAFVPMPGGSTGAILQSRYDDYVARMNNPDPFGSALNARA